MQGPLKGIHRMPTRSSHKDLMQGPLRGFLQGFWQISSQGPVQDHARTSERISSGSLLKLLPRSCTRSRKDFLEDFIWFHLDLHKIFSQGLLQDHKRDFTREFLGKCRAPDGSRDRDPHFARACAVEMHMVMSQEPEFARKMPRPRWIPRPRPTLCASLCSRNAHGHVTRAILCENLRASLCSRNAHGHVTSHFTRECTGKTPRAFREKCRAPDGPRDRDTLFGGKNGMV